jgi:hypothetical protein
LIGHPCPAPRPKLRPDVCWAIVGVVEVGLIVANAVAVAIADVLVIDYCDLAGSDKAIDGVDRIVSKSRGYISSSAAVSLLSSPIFLTQSSQRARTGF